MMRGERAKERIEGEYAPGSEGRKGEMLRRSIRLAPADAPSDALVEQSKTVSNAKQSLSAILAPDPEALAWVAAMRSRFANCKPLWGSSSVGSVGREP